MLSYYYYIFFYVLFLLYNCYDLYNVKQLVFEGMKYNNWFPLYLSLLQKTHFVPVYLALKSLFTEFVSLTFTQFRPYDKVYLYILL